MFESHHGGACRYRLSPRIAKLVCAVLLFTAIAINATMAMDSAIENPRMPVLQPSYFVSPSGNDSNSGTSTQEPFLTLEHARDAMRSSDVKVTYLLNGTFWRTASLSLTQHTDVGESWLAYPGQTPILDGRGTTPIAITFNVGHITVRGLRIQNFSLSGIDGCNSAGNAIVSNTIIGVRSPDTSHASIFLHFNLSDSVVSHNLISDNTGPGISLVAGSTAENNSNVRISNNCILATNRSNKDTGAIYILDRGHVSTGLSISSNRISNYGKSDADAKAIYMDDESSNAVIENNIISGTGSYCFQIHGGNNITVRNNIFDVSETRKLALYQEAVSAGFRNYGMSNNIFTQNVVYSSRELPNEIWDYLDQANVSISPPRIERNLYWSSQRVPFANAGTLVDKEPYIADPKFRDAPRGQYQFLSDSPALFQLKCKNLDESQMRPF